MRTLFALLLAWPFLLLAEEPGPREKLAAYLDSLQVETNWSAGVHVDWRTGVPDGKPITHPGVNSHCSAFAAAVCDGLGIYLLHPPEHPTVMLANAQADWLAGAGAKAGWRPVADGEEAQKLANAGTVVVAIYQEPDPTKHGHIAVVRPSAKSVAQIRKEGPEITQAGMENFSDAPLKTGFRHHPGAFSSNAIRFYAHDHTW